MLLQNKRILYVEDDQRNRKLVEMLLTGEGAGVFFERWGVPSLSMAVVLNHLPLDLILLDLMFPHGYSGYDIFKFLKKQPVLDGVPMVIISAADPQVEMMRARELGLSGYIAKPLDSYLFAQQVRDIIEGKPVWYAD